MDRNREGLPKQSAGALSLSARRAWIEIHHQSDARRPESVALRKESVDRNKDRCGVVVSGRPVALRKESVDRNSRAV